MAKTGDRIYREIFFAHNGPGPYACVECNKEVGFLEVLVHHDDHDRSNNNIENLMASHRGCHTAHHSTGRGVGNKASEETKQKMSESHKKRWAARSPEERSEIGLKSAANRDQSALMEKAWKTRKGL